jgi:hypothetical protein
LLICGYRWNRKIECWGRSNGTYFMVLAHELLMVAGRQALAGGLDSRRSKRVVWGARSRAPCDTRRARLCWLSHGTDERERSGSRELRLMMTASWARERELAAVRTELGRWELEMASESPAGGGVPGAAGIGQRQRFGARQGQADGEISTPGGEANGRSGSCRAQTRF